MANLPQTMADLPQGLGTTYTCKTCKLHFIIPLDETPVCCPVCRMNRIE